MTNYLALSKDVDKVISYLSRKALLTKDNILRINIIPYIVLYHS